MSPTVGFVALARPTFDVDYARETAEAALSLLRGVFDDVRGSAELVMEVAAARDTGGRLTGEEVDVVIVLQASFADSTLIAELSTAVHSPLVLWAVREERAGGRLRLNSFCGINLAAFALGSIDADYRWVYRDLNDAALGRDLRAAVEDAAELPAPTMPAGGGTSLETLTLGGLVVGLVGSRPDGFEPCDYDPDRLRALTGIEVDAVELDALFDAGVAAGEAQVSDLRSRVANLGGIEDVDQDALEQSLRLHVGLRQLVEDRGWDGVATRCWPECFTEFGGAACAPMAMLNSAGTPGCCEADVYGTVTSLLLQQIAGEPAFVADLVDVERESNTGVFWHCGLAPREMARKGDVPRATIHSNRRKPLLHEFALCPGRVTIARLSQAQGEQRLVVGGAEMLDDPIPFSGTSGVARFDSDASTVIDKIMGFGLEHHYGIVYGDHRDLLRDYAATLGIRMIEL